MSKASTRLRELADKLDSLDFVDCHIKEEGVNTRIYFTHKPNTHTVHNIHTGQASEVPRPLHVKPKKGTFYWVITFSENESVGLLWNNDKVDRLYFDSGNCFANKADALANKQAMFSRV